MPDNITTTLSSISSAADFEGDRPHHSYQLRGVCDVCDESLGVAFLPIYADKAFILLEEWEKLHRHERDD